VAVDRLAAEGDARAFSFPDASLHKGDHRYDVSYSGLKTAVVNQLDQFWNRAWSALVAHNGSVVGTRLNELPSIRALGTTFLYGAVIGFLAAGRFAISGRVSSEQKI